jgi:hypothetical protein
VTRETNRMRIRTALVLGPLLVLGLAGCGSGDGDRDGVASVDGGKATSSSAAPDTSEKEAALAFSRCMRQNGVPDFPDPEFGDNGEPQLGTPDGTDGRKLDAAQAKCKKYLPNGGVPEPPDPEKLAKLREYAQCMRDNGLPKFPDPSKDGGIQVQAGPGLDPNSSEYKAADDKCKKFMPGGGNGGSLHSETGEDG